MTHAAIPDDTDEKSWAVLVECWRSMSVIEKADLTEQMCLDVEQIARVGIARRYPTHTEIEICHELARRRYGDALADAAYVGLIPPR